MNKNKYLKSEILEFKFNEVNNKRKRLNTNKDAFKIIGLNKIEDFVEISDKDMDMIKVDKIKNKKNYILYLKNKISY